MSSRPFDRLEAGEAVTLREYIEDALAATPRFSRYKRVKTGQPLPEKLIADTAAQDGHIADLVEELQELRAMSDTVADQKYGAEYDALVLQLAGENKDIEAKRSLHDRLLAEIDVWQPPTDDEALAFRDRVHTDLIGQRDRIELIDIPVKQSGKEWRDERIVRLERELGSALERRKAARAQAEKDTALMQAILSSIGE